MVQDKIMFHKLLRISYVFSNIYRHVNILMWRYRNLSIISVHPVKYDIPKSDKINGSRMSTIYMLLTPRLALFNRVNPRRYLRMFVKEVPHFFMEVPLTMFETNSGTLIFCN